MNTPHIQTLQWQGEHFHTMECATVIKDQTIQISGSITGNAHARPVQVSYELQLSAAWKIKTVSLRAETSPAFRLTMHQNEAHSWQLESGVPLEELKGCTDVDISLSPLTNSLPINRVELPVGGTREIMVAYIDVLSATWKPARQRYTRRETGLYLYENMDTGFSAEITTDPDGYVIDYPGIWRRITAERSREVAAADLFSSRLVSIQRNRQYPAPDLFGSIIGSWNVRAVTYLENGSREIAGEWHFARTLEGRAVQDVWIAPKKTERTPHTPLQDNRYGTSLRIFDEKESTWRTYWFNPVTGEADKLTACQKGDNILQEGRDAGGNLIRWCFTDIQRDSFRWTGEISTDEGKNWKMENEFFASRISKT